MKLDGLKVIDLSQILPGPYVSMTMADHGAQVIRIEPPEGDPSRNLGPKQREETVWFSNTHRNKRSVALNLKQPDAVEAVKKLVEDADVFIESFRPGVASRLGLGHDTLRKLNPRIVYCSITAYGQTGPKALRPAHDLSVQADAGLLSLNVDQNGVPVPPGIVSADLAASLTALSGILMALLRRESTGKGDYVDIAMFDSLLAFSPHLMGSVFVEGKQPEVSRQRWYGGAAFYGVYRCADQQHLCLGGSELKFARNLLTALGRSDLVRLCALPPGPDQVEVKAFLTQTFAEHSLSYWEAFLGPIDICWSPIRELTDMVSDEQVKARGMLVKTAEGRTFLGTPIHFSDEPGRVITSVPRLGEHTTDWSLVRTANTEGPAQRTASTETR